LETKIKDPLKVSSSLVFFLINSVQVGVGILSFQSVIVQYAGIDSWISILIAGLGTHVIIWMMYKILSSGKNDDIVSIQRKIFGKWVGGFLTLIFVFYFFSLTIVTLRTYIQVINVWMFPRANIIMLALLFAILLYYIISGGFRVVAGICFLGVVIPMYLILTLLFPLEFANYSNLFPVMTHSIYSILLSAKESVFSFLGFSTLLFYYPFIKKPEASQKYAHFGVMFTVFIYLATCIVSFVFYSEGQIKSYLWPTLELWKIAEMPFVERFEFIGISSWALVILPNMSLFLWASSRGIKRIFGLNQRKTLIFLLFILVLSMGFIKGHDEVEQVTNYAGKMGFIIAFVYIPILFVVITVYKKVRKLP
jgi:spore germination protein (amino acid permease)